MNFENFTPLNYDSVRAGELYNYYYCKSGDVTVDSKALANLFDIISNFSKELDDSYNQGKEDGMDEGYSQEDLDDKLDEEKDAICQSVVNWVEYSWADLIPKEELKKFNNFVSTL